MATSKRFSIGDKFRLSSAALDNYGAEYAGRAYTVRAVYDHYVPSAKMQSDPTGHPGFDEGAGSALYGSELDFDLYEWEMVRVR